MKLGSLCSGIGGLDLACEAFFGAETSWQVEYDEPCQAVLERHWPDTKRYGDIHDVDFATVEPVDVLCAGYPCQPFSHAGKRQGEDDERHLWPDVARAISELRPRLAVLENVAGHLSLGFDRVLGDLAELGYDARWVVVRASDVGACHRRARLFCVAHPHGASLEAWGDRGSDGERPTPRESDGPHGGPGQTGSGLQPAVSLLPTPKAQEAQWDVAKATTAEGTPAEPNERAYIDGMHRTWGVQQVLDSGFWGRYSDAIARHARAVGRPAPAPCDDRRRLSPEFVEWMMMLPEGWTFGSRTQRLKQLGNAVVWPQAVHALRLLL